MLESECEKKKNPKKEEEKEKRRKKLAARVCLMAAASPLENSQVECELFRTCGWCAEHEATLPGNRQAEWPRGSSVQQTFV